MADLTHAYELFINDMKADPVTALEKRGFALSSEQKEFLLNMDRNDKQLRRIFTKINFGLLMSSAMKW